MTRIDMMNRMTWSLLAVVMTLALSWGAAAQTPTAKVVSGTAMVEAKNVSAGTLQLSGQTFVVTRDTEIRNARGRIIKLADIRSSDAESDGIITSDTADSVYYEAKAGERGVLIRVKIVEAMPE